MGLENRGQTPQEYTQTALPTNTKPLPGNEYYPYPLANPHVWNAGRALAGVSGAWIKDQLARQRQIYDYETTSERAVHAGKAVAAGAWAVYPFVSDAINLVTSRLTGNPYLAPVITTGIDVPILYAQAKVWERAERRKHEGEKEATEETSQPQASILDRGNKNIMPWTEEYKEYTNGLDRMLGREATYPNPVPDLSEAETHDHREELRPEERSLVGLALSPVLKHVDHGEALTTTLFAGSQLGLGEETIRRSRDNDDAVKAGEDVKIPSSGGLAMKHATVFGAESLMWGALASRGYDGGAVQTFTDIGLKFGLPLYLGNRALNLAFDVSPSKSFGYQGYEKIRDMVKNLKKIYKEVPEQSLSDKPKRVDPPSIPPNEDAEIAQAF